MPYVVFPGALLSALLALLSLSAAEWPAAHQRGLSALSLAMLGGMLIGNTVYPRFATACHPGVAWAKQTLLRAGIVLFGLRLTFHDLSAVGWAGALIDLLVLSSTFLLAYSVGCRWLGLDEHSVILIGAGSAICGAAAVLATEPVVRPRSDKVTVAVATVVVFGTLAMFLWPRLYVAGQAWGLSEFRYGLFTGSTLHEVAQVAVAGQSVSERAMNISVITKMLRVVLLAPFLLSLSWWLARREPTSPSRRQRVTVPWFALAFGVVIALNSWLPLPTPWKAHLVSLDNFLLASAMAALGLASPWRAIQQAGLRPLLLAGVLFGWLLLGGGLINAGVAWLTGG